MESNGLGVPDAFEVWVGVGGQTAAVAATLPWIGVEGPLAPGKSGGCGMCSAVVIVVAMLGILSFVVLFLGFFF